HFKCNSLGVPGMLPDHLFWKGHYRRVDAQLPIWTEHPRALLPDGLNVIEKCAVGCPRASAAIVFHCREIGRRGDDVIDRIFGKIGHDTRGGTDEEPINQFIHCVSRWVFQSWHFRYSLNIS